MKGAFKKISQEQLTLVRGSAWSIENMDAHGAAGRSTTYIGSEVVEHMIYDYYQDSAGAYWYKSRALLPSGEIVSMEQYIFGREIGKRKGIHRKW